MSVPPRPLELARLLVSRPRTAVTLIKFIAKGFAPASAAMKRDDMDSALRIFGEATLGAAAFARLSPARREQARANLIKAELLGSGFPSLDPAKVRRIDLPTLLVAGENSPALWSHVLDRLDELLPQVERVKVPDASHIMHEDNVPSYNLLLREFLEKHPSTAGNQRPQPTVPSPLTSG